jgi:hypothetical protein
LFQLKSYQEIPTETPITFHETSEQPKKRKISLEDSLDVPVTTQETQDEGTPGHYLREYFPENVPRKLGKPDPRYPNKLGFVVDPRKLTSDFLPNFGSMWQLEGSRLESQKDFRENLGKIAEEDPLLKSQSASKQDNEEDEYALAMEAVERKLQRNVPNHQNFLRLFK